MNMVIGLTDIPQIFFDAYEIHQRGCLDFVEGECDDCGLCEIEIPEEISEILRLWRD